MLNPVKTSCSLKLSTFFRVHNRNQMRFCPHHRSSLDFSKLLNSNTETPKPPLPLSPSFHLAACAVLLLARYCCKLGIHRGLRKCEINCTKFMECVVQGIIETQHVEALEILLQGLCGVSKKNLRVHEICLKNGPNLGLVASEVRLICDIEQSEQTEPTWTIRHIGGAMRGAGAEQLSVLVRSVVESKTSKNVLRFFYALGYKLDHELLRVGFSFHFQRGTQINVTVSSVNKMLQLHDVDAAVPVTPGIQLVEVTAPATSENYAEVVAAVSSFSEYLAPLLHLSKPGTSTGVVPTAAAAAASLLSDGGGTTL